MVGPYQSGDPQVFERDQVVVTHEVECYRMMEILALTTHFLVLPGEQLTRLSAAFTTLLLAREPTLRLLEWCLCLAVVTRILNTLSIRSDKEHLQADINAGLATSQWEWLHGHFSAGETGVSPISFTAHRHWFCLS